MFFMRSILAVGSLCCILQFASAAQEEGRVLHNGIRLPDEWPPHAKNFSDDPSKPSYLKSPPKLITIDVGRQLFVDDFLIESTTLRRMFHQPTYFEGNPVLKPDKPWEKLGRGPMAMPFSGGIWFDPQDKLLKMWYMAGYGKAVCYATSKDGILWQKPELDVVPGTNIVYNHDRGSTTVWRDDRERDSQKRFKMMQHQSGNLLFFSSADGIHWSKPLSIPRPVFGDRSTFFFNPFRKKWVFSIRSSPPSGRSRHYWETDNFFGPVRKSWGNGPVIWTAADKLDRPREDLQVRPQLYNLDCVAYESLLLGFFSIWRGDYRFDAKTEQAVKLQGLGRPKQNSICIGFSRDGFQWDRPVHRAFCQTSEKRGDWNWGNLQSVANACLVMGDQIYIYMSGRAGLSFPECKYTDAGGSTGLAILRRDGFASMNAGVKQGTLVTRAIQFSGKHLCVNLEAAGGELLVEALDENQKVIPPFTRKNCDALSVDKTLALVRWKGAADLSALAKKPVRFRFILKQGKLYSFWVSPDRSGTSHGYIAVGPKKNQVTHGFWRSNKAGGPNRSNFGTIRKDRLNSLHRHRRRIFRVLLGVVGVDSQLDGHAPFALLIAADVPVGLYDHRLVHQLETAFRLADRHDREGPEVGRARALQIDAHPQPLVT